MSELVDFYKLQVQTQRSTIPWLAKLQKRALNDFIQLGFPTHHHEDWRYTPVEPLLKQSFAEAHQTKHLDDQAVTVVAAGRQTDVPVGKKIAIVNGVVIGLDALLPTLPPGVIVKPLSQALEEDAEKIKPYLGKMLQHEHAFQALNTAMLHGGLFIYVPQHVRVSEPLLLTHWQTSSMQAVHLRHLVIAEPGSMIDIIEDYQGDTTASYLTNTVTEIAVAAEATVRHYKIQREGSQAFHLGHLAICQQQRSRFVSHLLNIGAQWSRSDITLNLAAVGATCLLNGIYAPNHDQLMDQHTVINHLVPACGSEQDYKGILSGHAKGVFNGKVYVAQDAQETKAAQQNKNLLLSKTAEIDTKPQLDIYADNVICTHGATVGQLDEDALFYFATRGIDQTEANRYLIQAFAADNLQAMDNKTIASWMANLLDHQIR